MDFSETEFLDRILAGDLRAVSRLITLSENRSPRARTVQSALFRNTGKAQVIGITGSPGAGKSTLVDQLAVTWVQRGKRVAIIAVDPTSPFSGGAILGDRIRMNRAVENAGVFIRSMATRGSLGGVSRATLGAIQILDAAGFDIILVETVGVGQAEVEIVQTADTVIVVVVPGMGDTVQAFKAGILEIADVFVINKSDREGADLVFRDLRLLLSLGDYPQGSWTPAIVKSVATTGQGVVELVDLSEQHSSWLKTSQVGEQRRFQIMKATLAKLAEEMWFERTLFSKESLLNDLAMKCLRRQMDPHEAVDTLLDSPSLPSNI